MTKNPFLETFLIPYIKYVKKDVSPMKMLEKGLEKDDYFNVELDKYSRVYRNTDHFPVLCGLKANGFKLVLWIIYHIPETATYIKLDDIHLSKVFQCSDRQVARMRKELISNGIIAKRQYNEYWINPRYFSAGDRLKLYSQQAIEVAIKYLK